MPALSVYDIDPWYLKLILTVLVSSFALQMVWSLTFTLRIVTIQQKSTALPGQNYVSLLCNFFLLLLLFNSIQFNSISIQKCFISITLKS